MSKPNSPKCKTCTVINNKLRCGTCKYKTKEWLYENISTVMLFGDFNNYREKDSFNCGAKMEESGENQ